MATSAAPARMPNSHFAFDFIGPPPEVMSKQSGRYSPDARFISLPGGNGFSSDFRYDMSDIMKTRAVTLEAAVVRGADNSRAPKAQKVVDTLGSAIVAGRRPAGSVLPTEEELSRRLRISRTSLRQGMHALALKGLVDTR